MPTQSMNKDDYIYWLGEVKCRIQSARGSAARAINCEMILLYWDIGCGIVEKQDAQQRSTSIAMTDEPSQVEAIIRPKNTDEVSKVMKLCFEAGQAIIPLGGN